MHRFRVGDQAKKRGYIQVGTAFFGCFLKNKQLVVSDAACICPIQCVCVLHGMLIRVRLCWDKHTICLALHGYVCALACLLWNKMVGLCCVYLSRPLKPHDECNNVDCVKNIPADKVCNNQWSWLLATFCGVIYVCVNQLLSFFYTTRCVCSNVRTGEHYLLLQRDCIKSVPLFSLRARHSCWVTLINARMIN